MKIFNQGFTLVEILIASAIALIVGLFLTSILINNNGVFYKQSSLVNTGLSSNDVMSEIDKSITQAVSVAVAYPQDTPLYTTGANTLILKVPALGADGSIENVYDYIVIAKDASKNNVLRKKVFPDVSSIRKAEDLVMTTILNSISFNYLNKAGVIVEPQTATSVKTTLKVQSNFGAVSSDGSSSAVTTLKNAL